MPLQSLDVRRIGWTAIQTPDSSKNRLALLLRLNLPELLNRCFRPINTVHLPSLGLPSYNMSPKIRFQRYFLIIDRPHPSSRPQPSSGIAGSTSCGSWINELKLARLREQLQEGMVQLDQGDGVHVDGKASLDELFEGPKA